MVQLVITSGYSRRFSHISGKSVRMFSHHSKEVPNFRSLINSKSLNDLLDTDPAAKSDPLFIPKFLMEHLKPMTLLPKEFVIDVLDRSIAYFKSLDNVVAVDRAVDTATGERGELTVVGDTHGQYHDFCRIFHSSMAGEIMS